MAPRSAGTAPPRWNRSACAACCCSDRGRAAASESNLGRDALQDLAEAGAYLWISNQDPSTNSRAVRRRALTRPAPAAPCRAAAAVLRRALGVSQHNFQRLWLVILIRTLAFAARLPSTTGGGGG